MNVKVTETNQSKRKEHKRKKIRKIIAAIK
jgi:hypothetical protein